MSETFNKTKELKMSDTDESEGTLTKVAKVLFLGFVLGGTFYALDKGLDRVYGTDPCTNKSPSIDKKIASEPKVAPQPKLKIS